MNTRLILAFLSLVSACLFGLSAHAGVTDKPVVIVIGEDSGLKSVSRFNLVFVRIQDAIIGEFREKGFVAFDETKAAEGNFRDEVLERSDSELVMVSQSVTNASIDVALVIAVFFEEESGKYSKTLRFRVVSRAINVKTRAKLGTYEAAISVVLTVARDCSKECILSATNRQGDHLARRVRAAIAPNLIALVSNER